MKSYIVLWFDDEFDKLETIKDDAFINDILLVGFKNATDGLLELERNLFFYDAVLVDGKFYNNATNIGDAVDDSAMVKVARALDKLEDKKKIPWFILSGQFSFTKDVNPYANAYKNNKVYDKNKDEDFDSLWLDIKRESDTQLDTQIRHKYEKVFETCTQKYIGEEVQKPLLQILKSLNEPTDSFDDELYFTQIRIILESMFRAANKIGLLHDDCLQGGKVNLSESSLFLSGDPTKHIEVICSKRHFSRIVADSVKSIIFITGAASHTVDPDLKNNINLTKYRTVINTPYLLYSLTFQLMDILIWFKKYADQNPDKEKNKSFWLRIEEKPGDWQEGTIISLNISKGFAFFKPNIGVANTIIPSYIVSGNHLANNDRVSVVIEQYEDTVTKEIKTRVKQLKKIK